MWNHLVMRIASSVIGILVVLLIMLNDIIYMDIAIGILAIILLHEFFNISGYKNKWLQHIAAYIFTLAIMLTYFLKNPQVFSGLVFLYIVVMFIICMVNIKTIRFSEISNIFLMTMYVSITLAHIHLVRINLKMGDILVFFVFLGAFGTDTGAYFIGKIFGQHKLIEDVSPKKTIEGSIGGVCASIVTMMGFALITSYYFHIEYNYFNLFIMSILASAVAQVGDLVGSVIKREYSVKDFGNMMPGHGGMFDRVDSLIAVAPLVYYFIRYFGILR